MQENLLIQKVRNEKPDEEHRDTDNESFYRVYHRERHFSVCPEIFKQTGEVFQYPVQSPCIVTQLKSH